MPAHSKRTPEMVEAILEGMSKGQTLTSLCATHGITRKSWGEWCAADDALRFASARAREDGCDVIGDEILTIVDDLEEDPASRRVRSDARLKLLARWDPKRWGDKLGLGHADGMEPVKVAYAEWPIPAHRLEQPK
jgi:hypothetical protein